VAVFAGYVMGQGRHSELYHPCPRTGRRALPAPRSLRADHLCERTRFRI